MPRLRSLGLFFASLTLGCSLINAPDEINPGTGGTGSGAGGTGATGASGGTGGTGGGPCEGPEDCESLTTDCATGECDAGTCVATPMPAGTLCGAAPATTCDLQDACDDSGSCVSSFVPDGTFCTDCAAGPGNCETCQSGVCGDCSTRATTKTFRHPLSASGWTLTGGWGIYSAAPPVIDKAFHGGCNDGLSNDGDGLIDVADASCTGPNDPLETQPSQCQNGVDDDGDGFFDLNDPECSNNIGDDREAAAGPIPFDHPVLGSDGNRKRPYGFTLSTGQGEFENSTAVSPPTVLPTQLQFLSWHFDEGLAFDLKSVEVSTNNVNYELVALCTPMSGGSPFCTEFFSNQTRAGDDWDMVTLSVPPSMQGEVGYVRFTYNTQDSLFGWERGWFIDALNFGQDCACDAASDCTFLSSDCATGTCDSATNECSLAPENTGDACVSTGDDGCALNQCNAAGWCESEGMLQDGAQCMSCGEVDCAQCIAGDCKVCPPIQTLAFVHQAGFTLTGDAAFSACLSQNSINATILECFPTPTSPTEEERRPVLGSNGSRTNANPWTAVASEVSSSSFRTSPTVIPATLSFKSWHQDRGGNNQFNLRDAKVIRVSIDNGGSWVPVFNCSGNMTTAMCQPSNSGVNRPLDTWDAIDVEIDDDLVGETGIFEFSYDTIDAGQGWERGWYVDDLNINRCDCEYECPLPPAP